MHKKDSVNLSACTAMKHWQGACTFSAACEMQSPTTPVPRRPGGDGCRSSSTSTWTIRPYEKQAAGHVAVNVSYGAHLFKFFWRRGLGGGSQDMCESESSVGSWCPRTGPTVRGDPTPHGSGGSVPLAVFARCPAPMTEPESCRPSVQS